MNQEVVCNKMGIILHHFSFWVHWNHCWWILSTFIFSLFFLYISYINPAQFLVILPRGPLLCQHVVRTLQKWFGHLSHMSSSRIYVHYEWFDPLVQKLQHFEKNKRLRLADHMHRYIYVHMYAYIYIYIYIYWVYAYYA